MGLEIQFKWLHVYWKLLCTGLLTPISNNILSRVFRELAIKERERLLIPKGDEKVKKVSIKGPFCSACTSIMHSSSWKLKHNQFRLVHIFDVVDDSLE